MNTTDQTITLTLNEDEVVLIEMLARERSLSAEEALRALLHDAVAIYDALWDRKFAESQDLLDRLADEAHKEYLAGLTEDFDPETDAP